MQGINVLKPAHMHHHVPVFKDLTTAQKIVTVFAAIVVSLITVFLATAALIRSMINRYVTVLHPKKMEQPIKEIAPGAKPILLPAQKTHNVAQNHIDPSGKINQALTLGSSVPVEMIERFNVDMLMRVIANGLARNVHVQGLCDKATIHHNEDTRFAYKIDLSINDTPLQMGFISSEDANNTESIGKLMLRHFNQLKRLEGNNGPRSIMASQGSPAIAQKDEEPRNHAVSQEEDVVLPIINFDTEASFEDTVDLSATEVTSIFDIDYSPLRPLITDDSIRGSSILTESHILTDFIESRMSPEEKKQQAELDEANKREQEGFRKGLEEEKEEIARDNGSFFTKSMRGSVILKASDRINLGLEESACNIVPSLFDFLRDPKLKDDDLITLKKGVIEKATEEEAKKFYPEFRHILKETYGTVLANGVFERHKIDKKDRITLLDLKKAMVGVAKNVRKLDLERLFGYIKHGTPGDLASYRAGNNLFHVNAKLYNDIRARESFDELLPQEIQFLHSAFTRVSKGSASLNIGQELVKPNADDGAQVVYPSGIDYIFMQDLLSLHEMSYWKDLDLDHPEKALGEYFGKAIGYLELHEGMVIPTPDVVGGTDKPQFYKVSHSLENKNDAVISHILTPLNSQQTPFDAENEYAVMIFRGTNIDSGALAGGESLYRDLHWEGIGRAAYNRREAEILQMVENYLVSVQKDNVTLQLAGHSLGGCDTQRALVSILEKIASAEEGSVWKKLKKIILTTHNAPKPEPDINTRMKLVCKAIHEEGLDLEVDIKHVRFYDKTREDWLENQGDVLLGADYAYDGIEDEFIKEATFLKRELTTFTVHEQPWPVIGALTNFLKRHGYRPFNNKLFRDIGFTADVEILNASNEDERKKMEKKMAGNFYWNTKEMGNIERYTGNVTWGATTLVRKVGGVAQAIVNFVHYGAIQAKRWLNGTSYDEVNKQREAIMNAQKAFNLELQQLSL